MSKWFIRGITGTTQRTWDTCSMRARVNFFQSCLRRLVTLCCMAGLVASLSQRTEAVIITVDFEARPLLPTQPNDFFAAGASDSYSDLNYAIGGGVVLGDPAFLAAFATHGSLHNLYMTTDIADPSLLDTITLDLPLATVVVGVTGVLFNGQAATESYVVTAFSGVVAVNTVTFNNVEAVSSTNAFRNFSLNSTLALPITRVTVTTPNAGATPGSCSSARSARTQPKRQS